MKSTPVHFTDSKLIINDIFIKPHYFSKCFKLSKAAVGFHKPKDFIAINFKRNYQTYTFPLTFHQKLKFCFSETYKMSLNFGVLVMETESSIVCRRSMMFMDRWVFFPDGSRRWADSAVRVGFMLRKKQETVRNRTK